MQLTFGINRVIDLLFPGTSGPTATHLDIAMILLTLDIHTYLFTRASQ